MDDTIDFRQLIESLLRGRWLIAGVTLIAMLVAGVMSFIVIAPTFEARTTLLVTLPQGARGTTGTGLSSLLDQVTATPQTSMETIRLRVTSPAVLSDVIAALQLETTPEKLAEKVTAQVPKDTTLLQVAVKDTDPVLAAEIANTVVSVFVDHVDRLNKEQARLNSRFLEDQMAAEQQRLEQATAELKAFLQQPKGTDELEQELSAKLTLLTEYEAKKVQLQVERDAVRSEVEQAEQLVSSLPDKLTTSRVVADDAVLHQLATGMAGDAIAAAGLRLDSEEVNQAWVEAAKLLAVKRVELSRVEAQLTALDAAIATTQKELEALRTELVDKRTVQQQLEYRVNLADAALRTLTQKYHEVKVSEGARIAETSVSVVSPALVPTRPVAPRKLMNVAVAGVLGLMIGVGTALFADFWRNSGATAEPAGSRAIG